MGFFDRMSPGWGIAAVRMMMGIILIVAGYQKFAGGIGGFAGFLSQIGIPAPELVGWIIPTLELVGGGLILLGLGTRWIALLFAGQFLVITFYMKLPRPAPVGGWDSARIDLMLLAAAVMLVLAGPGKAALDELLRRRRTAVVGP